MAIKTLSDFDIDGELKATSLDVNGNADISGNLSGVDTLTAQDFVGTGSYHEFGNGTGSVSNDGSWHGRLNVAGAQHARIDVKDLSDGIITSMFSHTGHAAGKLGTYSNHPVHLMVNGSSKATLDSSSNFAVTGELEGGSLDINGAATIDGTTTITSSSTAALKIIGGTGVDTTGSFVLRQNGDGAGNGIAITSSNATSHRLWKDASGNFNIGSSANSNAFKQDTTGNVTIEGTIGSGAITSTSHIESAQHFKATGNNLSLHAGGNQILNIDLNKNIYPVADGDTDLGFSSTAYRFRSGYFTEELQSGSLDINGNADISGNATLGGIIMDGNTVTGIDDSGEFTDDDAHIMTSAAINDKFATYNWVNSRGENLFSNGSGLLGDITNMPGFTFDGSHANNSPGSFKWTGTGTPNTSEAIPVDASRKYKMQYDAKTENGVGRYYGFTSCFDVDGIAINSHNHMYRENTLTTLAVQLVNGATTITLTDSANWNNAGTAGSSNHLRSLIIWNYTNSFGYTYPEETYSRNYTSQAWDPGDINFTSHVITLRVAWAGGTIAAGTKVSNGSAGGTYKYNVMANKLLTTDWVRQEGYMDGVDYTGTNNSSKFPPGTAKIKLGWLMNYQNLQAGEVAWFTNINVGVAAHEDDEIAEAVERATDSNTFTDADHTKLNAIEAGATADQTVTNSTSTTSSTTVASATAVKAAYDRGSLGVTNAATNAAIPTYKTTSSANASVGPGWITVASNTSDRKHGEIIVSDGESSDHAFIRIDWLRSYADTNFSVLNVGGHANRITGVRVLNETSDITYGTKLLQVYVTAQSNYYVKVNTVGVPYSYVGHTAVTPVVENTKTGYALQGNQIEDLQDSSLAAEQGISVGGNSVFGGTIGSGAITSTGKVTGTELEGTSLDINGNADIAGSIALSAGGNSTTAGINNSGNYLHLQAINGSTAKPQLWMGNSSDLGVYTNASIHYWRKIDNTNIATLTTGQFTVTGEIEATSLDINGDADISGNLTGVDTLTATTFSGDLNGTINTATTAATQSASNNSTKVATTAYVDAQVATVVDSAPGTLNTLNELAAALGDDASFSTTVTNSIAAKLPLAGGIMSGPVKFSSTTYGAFDSENFFRIKLQDVGGVHNDVGIGQTASNNLGFNTTAGGTFTFNNGTAGNKLTLAETLSTFSTRVTVGADTSGHDVKFFGNATGEYMLWDESASQLNIRHDTDDAGLNIFTVSSASMTQPQLKVGRDGGQYWGVYTDDRNAHMVHRQDETSGTMTTRFDQWDSNTSDPAGNWLWRHGNGTGGSMATALTLTQAGNATFAGSVTVGDDLNIAGDELTFTNDAASAYIRGADALIIESDHDNDDASSKPIYLWTNGTEMAKFEATAATFAGTIDSGAITSTSTVTADTYFQSSDTSAVLASQNNGSVFLRPNGVGSGTGAFSISAAGKATVDGELEATSLDINGNADISGDLTGVDTLTATTLSVTNYGLASGDIPNNAANTTGTAAGLSATLAIASGGTAATNSNGWLNSRITTSADGSLNYDAASAVAVNHDSLAGFVAAEHVDWAGSGAGTIHASNYIENVAGNLGVTANGTSLTVTTTNGTSIALPAATTSAWGVMTSGMFDAIAANTVKGDLVVDADEGTKGIIEIASVEEATAGDDESKAVTAAGVAAHVQNRKVHELAAPTAALAMNSQKVTGVADPTAAQDAATKAYTDAKTWNWNDITAGTVPTFNQNTTGSARTLTTTRAIYGNNFDGSAAVTGTIATAYIADDAITEDKLANTLLAEIDANTTKNTSPSVYGEYLKLIPKTSQQMETVVTLSLVRLLIKQRELALWYEGQIVTQSCLLL